jgi:3-isopropylmalate/(R)-2-methylmalate dehydratase large subunit
VNTLYEKLIDTHAVTVLSADEVLLYVSLHIMNEYTSPQAFSGLHAAGRPVWRPHAHLGVIDHVNSTRRAGAGDGDEQAQLLIDNFSANCRRHRWLCR